MILIDEFLGQIVGFILESENREPSSSLEGCSFIVEVIIHISPGVKTDTIISCFSSLTTYH